MYYFVAAGAEAGSKARDSASAPSPLGPEDRTVLADVGDREPLRPGHLADDFDQRIRVRPADTDVDVVRADGVVGDRQPLFLPLLELCVTQRVGTVERREGPDEVAVEGPDRRGRALGGVVVARLLPPGDLFPPLGKVLIGDRVRLEDQDVVAHTPRLEVHPVTNHGHRSPRRPPTAAHRLHWEVAGRRRVPERSAQSAQST